MPVEIVILSGAQQGTRQVLDRSEFRVGSKPACDVKFDPQQDRSAVDREAVFRLTDDGWTVSSTGLGEIFLNQQPLTRAQRVRSGDVLRLSNQGPDLAFNITSGTPAADLSVGDGSAMAQKAVRAARAARLPTPVDIGHRGRWFQGLIGLGILTLIALLIAQWRPGNHPHPAPQSSAGEKPAVVPPDPAPPEHKVTGSVSPTPANRAMPDTTPKPVDADPPDPKPGDPKPPEPKPPEPKPVEPVPSATPPEVPPSAVPSLEERLKGTVFLIEVESRQRRMPFANGVAVSDKLVLTTAKQAVQLARWRKQGMAEKIWVIDHLADVGVEVQDIRVLGDCAATPADSPNWVYCNLALLTVATKLPKHLALATPTDLEKVRDGVTVFCMGIPHEGVPMSDPEELRPVLTKCRIHFVTVASDLSSKPRLLHLKAELSPNLFGSPIVTKDGQLVGVYGHPAVAPEQGATPEVLEMVKNLHYALAVSSTVIPGGQTGSPGPPWIAADSVPLPSSEAQQ